MSFSNDSRYFCGGRLFTIFSFSQCLACLIAPCASALAWGYFSALIAKERITWLCLCWRWGSNPPKQNKTKKSFTPRFHSYPEHSLNLLVSSITSNLLTTGLQVGTCCVLSGSRAVWPVLEFSNWWFSHLLTQCSNYQRCYLCNFLWKVMERFP